MSVRLFKDIENKGIYCLKSPSQLNGRFPHQQGKQDHENPATFFYKSQLISVKGVVANQMHTSVAHTSPIR